MILLQPPVFNNIWNCIGGYAGSDEIFNVSGMVGMPVCGEKRLDACYIEIESLLYLLELYSCFDGKYLSGRF